MRMRGGDWDLCFSSSMTHHRGDAAYTFVTASVSRPQTPPPKYHTRREGVNGQEALCVGNADISDSSGSAGGLSSVAPASVSQYTNLTLRPNQRNSRRPFPPSLESTHL